MTRIATCGFFEKGPEGSHGNARLTKLRSKRGIENARIKFFPSAVSRTCFIIRYDALKKTLLQIGIFPRTWIAEFCYFRRLA